MKKNGVRSWLIFAISAGIVLVSIASAYFRTNGKADRNSLIVKELSKNVDANESRVGQVEDEVIGLKKDIGHINEKMTEGFDRIEVTQTSILNEIKDLHK